MSLLFIFRFKNNAIVVNVEMPDLCVNYCCIHSFVVSYTY